MLPASLSGIKSMSSLPFIVVEWWCKNEGRWSFVGGRVGERGAGRGEAVCFASALRCAVANSAGGSACCESFSVVTCEAVRLGVAEFEWLYLVVKLSVCSRRYFENMLGCESSSEFGLRGGVLDTHSSASGPSSVGRSSAKTVNFDFLGMGMLLGGSASVTSALSRESSDQRLSSTRLGFVLG